MVNTKGLVPPGGAVLMGRDGFECRTSGAGIFFGCRSPPALADGANICRTSGAITCADYSETSKSKSALFKERRVRHPAARWDQFDAIWGVETEARVRERESDKQSQNPQVQKAGTWGTPGCENSERTATRQNPTRNSDVWGTRPTFLRSQIRRRFGKRGARGCVASYFSQAHCRDHPPGTSIHRWGIRKYSPIDWVGA